MRQFKAFKEAVLMRSLLLIVYVFFAFTAVAGARPDDIPHGSVVVAVVNGNPITFAEVWKRVDYLLEGARLRLSGEAFKEEARRWLSRVREDLIRRVILLEKAKERGVSVTEKQVEELARREMQYENVERGANITSLEGFWRTKEEKTGFTEEEYRKELRARALMQELFRDILWRPEYYSPKVLRSYYRGHKEEFRQGGYFVVRRLYIRRKLLGYKDIVKKIRNEISEGRDFKEIVEWAIGKGYSLDRGSDDCGKYVYKVDSGNGAGEDDGAIEYFATLDDVSRPLSEAITSLEAGEVSEGIRTAFGIHFVKVLRRKGGRVQRFSEVQKQIQAKLREKRKQELRRQFTRKLAEKADITCFPFPEETPLGRVENVPLLCGKDSVLKGLVRP